MRVTKVLDPASNAVSYTVVGVAGVVEPAERYLRYLAETERSPDTIKAHAHDLKDWFVFLNEYGLDWQSVKLEDVGAFIRWLRRPPDIRGPVFSVLPTIGHHCGEATVNRKLSTVSIFYQHAARHGLDLGELIKCWDPSARSGGWKPFLHHISKGAAKQRRVVKLPVTARIPRLLAPDEVQSILDSCEHLRDRLLFALLHDAGIRIGEALGLRPEDIAVAEREITVRRRDNTNGARAKSPHSRTVPVTAELIRLYADYLDVEYGDLDSDYVFVNLWGRPYGQAMTYAAVHDLVRRLRRQTGVTFDPHWFRHTYATRMLRENVPVEVVSKLLGHASLTTTVKTYAHISSDDARRTGRCGLVRLQDGDDMTTLPSRNDPPPIRTRPMGKAGSDAAPWETEFPKDVWHARALGVNARSQVTVYFENITRPWLKQLAKQWARWRLTTGLTVESAVLGTKAVESFNAFLDSSRIPVNGTSDIDRAVIEGFLAYLHTHSAGAPSHRIRIGQFNTFLLTMRRHGWVTDLPSTAQIYTEDYPKETVRQPRALSEYVMDQLENPENLAKMASPHHRLITLILIRCGLRISDTVALTQDCITRDKDGAPYLRYLNHKMKREALVPIDE